MSDLVKRKWCYLQTPRAFEIAPCDCGNEDTLWSEYEKHLWCEVCQKDFIPEHGGIFDGPIAVNTAMMLGLSFDRYNIETKQIERYNPDTNKYSPEEQED